MFPALTILTLNVFKDEAHTGLLHSYTVPIQPFKRGSSLFLITGFEPLSLLPF